MSYNKSPRLLLSVHVFFAKFISLNIHFNNQTESANPAFISTCNLAQKKHTTREISAISNPASFYTLFF